MGAGKGHVGQGPCDAAVAVLEGVHGDEPQVCHPGPEDAVGLLNHSRNARISLGICYGSGPGRTRSRAIRPEMTRVGPVRQAPARTRRRPFLPLGEEP